MKPIYSNFHHFSCPIHCPWLVKLNFQAQFHPSLMMPLLLPIFDDLRFLLKSQLLKKLINLKKSTCLQSFDL